MGTGFRQVQFEMAKRCHDVLRATFDVVDLGMISSLEEARALGERTGTAAQFDAVVYAPTMVAPPEWIESILSKVSCPIVVWSATRFATIAKELDHLKATVDTSLVGATMIANCLVRDRRPFVAVDAALGNPADELRLKRSVTAAAAYRQLSRAVALRIGTPIAGYRDVETTAEELRAAGVQEIQVSASDLEQRVAGVSSHDTQMELTKLRSRPAWQMTETGNVDTSVRLAIALRRLAEEHAAALGTVNCHSRWFRQSERVGIVACLGVSLLHEAGIPFSCTGDLPAAMAGFLAKALSGSSLYCELYGREPETGEFLLAAGGEGDPTWAEGGAVTVIPNEYYPGRCGAGLGLRFSLCAGPATLISMTPSTAGWRLIWAPGTVTERSFPGLDGPNGMFRFDTHPAHTAAERWMAAGPTHHPALARGILDIELPIVSALSTWTEIRV